MKTTLQLIYCIIFSMLLFNNTNAQVTGVNYQLKYDTVECRYDVFLIINSGSATTVVQRIQANAQLTLVVPTGTSVGSPINFMPLQSNNFYTGTVPMSWEKKPALVAPLAQPESDFHSITPKLSPVSAYNDLFTGDEVKLFSIEITPVPNCGIGTRFFENGVDPTSSDPGMNGADFSNGMTLGGSTQIYEANSATIFPTNPVLDGFTTCSLGVEIDVTASATSCQSPFTYEWTGPDGYASTDEDVNIVPAIYANTGTYNVTVTDALGCQDSLTIDAVSKPNAGIDQDGCTESTVDISGKEPITGIWTADPANNAGTTLVLGIDGLATVDVSVSAIGDYNFIYSNEGCSDTMTISVLNPDAGADPSQVNCFSNGTVSMTATGTGTWSLGAGSAGTVTIASPTNPLSTVTDFSDFGTYYMVWTEGACTDTAVIVTLDNCGCPIANNSLLSLDPPTYCGSSSFVTIDGNAATPAGTYLWQYTMNGGVYANAVGTNDTEDYITAVLSVGMHSFRRIYSTVIGEVCSDTSNVVSFTVLDIPTAPLNLMADTNPICEGVTGSLNVTQAAGATYNWTAPANLGLIPSTSNVATFIAGNSGFYMVSVTAIIDGCESTPATLEIEVNPVPPTMNSSTIIITDPSACGIADGSIRLIGLGDNTNYEFNYDYNGNAQTMNITSNSFGMVVINALLAGDYTNFELISDQGCASGIYPGPVSLLDPNPPPAPDTIFAVPNPVCLGELVTIYVPDYPNATFIWSASSPDAGLASSTDSVVTMLATVPGLYTISAIQVVEGCSSPSISIGVSINDAPQTLIPADITSTDPSVCGGMDGLITISGLNALTTYTLTYLKNGTNESSTLVSSNSGILSLNGLTEGSYTNFVLTNFIGCASGVYAGPVSLADPGSPNAPANLLADPNPTCLGNIISLSVDDNPSATFNWSASSPDAGLVTSNSNTTTMNPVAGGTYTISVSQSEAGCTSPTSSITVEVGDTPPSPSNVTFTNPTVCGGVDGSISLSVYNLSSNYTVLYNKDGSPQSVDLTSDPSGTIILLGLTSGAYTDIVISNGGPCTSNPYPGPINLVEPGAPSAPASLTANPNPGCVSDPINLFVVNNPGAVYTWSVSPATGGIVSSTSNETIMIPTDAGTFTVSVVQTVAGCTSPASIIDVIAEMGPPAPGAANISTTNPSVCSGSDGEFRIDGLTPNTNYTIRYEYLGNPVNVSVLTNASGVASVLNLVAGSYSNILVKTIIGCFSEPYVGPITLSDPGAPNAPSGLAGVPNPVCLGSSVNLSVIENPNAVYTWSASSPNAGLVSTTSSFTTMSPSSVGTFTIDVVQSVDGCLSPAAVIDIDVIAVPPTPTINTIVTVDPLVCGINDGTITLTGYTANETYVVSYMFEGNAVSLNIMANNNGMLMISNIAPGNYTNFTVKTVVGNCFSDVYPGPVTIDGPPAPDAPVGLNAVPNPVCAGTLIDLSTTNNPGAIYSWSASSVDAGLEMSTTNTTTMLSNVAGMYTISVTQNINDCESPAAWIDVEILPLPAQPNNNSITVTNPTCGADDGAISITGYVPMEIVTLNYQFEGQDYSLQVTANINGALELFNLAVGFYSNVSVSYGNGCNSGNYNGVIELEEPCSGSIGSYTWIDRDGDGIHDNTEYGLANVIVNLYDDQNQLIETTISGADGYYIFESVFSGTYYIQFIASDEFTTTFPNEGNDEQVDSDVDDTNGIGTTAFFDLGNGEVISNIRAGYYKCSKIGDNVWYDINENDIFDVVENGINGLKVNLYRKQNGSWVFYEQTVTGHKPNTPSDDGYYLFCVAPGEYYVEIPLPPEGLVTARPFIGNDNTRDSDINHANGFGTTPSFSLSSEQHKLDIGAGYYPMAVAGNLVWRDMDGDGLQEFDEPMVEGISVEAFNADTDQFIGSDVTDEYGVYFIENIEKVDIYLKFDLPSNMVPTLYSAGDYTRDSDVNHAYGLNTTKKFSMSPGVVNENIDLGIVFGPLPLNWLEVGVINDNNKHLVSWKVEDEINVLGYTVERSIDNDNYFEEITNKIVKSNNTIGVSSYNFVDNDIIRKGIYYYRIKQIDRDGKISYSEIFSITNVLDFEIKMFPNPSTETTRFEYWATDDGKIEVELFTNQGKLLISHKEDVEEKLINNSFDFDVSSLPPGVYNVVIKMNTNTIRKKLVIID